MEDRGQGESELVRIPYKLKETEGMRVNMDTDTGLVIYHHDGMDGFVAAWVVEQSLGKAEAVIPLSHNEFDKVIPEQCANRNVVMVDICPKTEELLVDLADKANYLTVIDHHASSKKMLEGFQHLYATVVHDTNHSACVLARLFYGTRLSKTGVLITDYVEDRDLWKWEMDASREVNEALAAQERGFWALTGLSRLPAGEFIVEMEDIGKHIMRYRETIIDEIVAKTAQRQTFAGFEYILMVNSSALGSEIGDRLSKDEPFVVIWSEGSDGLCKFELRSDAGTPMAVDVGKLAVRLGGGGHTNASGLYGRREDLCGLSERGNP